MSKYYECRTNDTPRFSSLLLQEVEEYAKKIFKKEEVIAEIYELENNSRQ